MYSTLRQKLIDEDDGNGQTGGFGFLLERLWAVVMQCADERIADRCPSLFSGTLGRLGRAEDCQCLDPVQGS